MRLPRSNEPILLRGGRVYYAASVDRAAYRALAQSSAGKRSAQRAESTAGGFTPPPTAPDAEAGAFFCDGARFPIYRGPTLDSLVALVAELNRAELVAAADTALRRGAQAPNSPARRAALDVRAIDAVLDVAAHLCPPLAGGRLSRLARLRGSSTATQEAEPIDRLVPFLDARLYGDRLRAVKQRRSTASARPRPAPRPPELDVFDALARRFRDQTSTASAAPAAPAAPADGDSAGPAPSLVARLLERARERAESRAATYLVYGGRISTLGPAGGKHPIAAEVEGEQLGRHRTVELDFAELLGNAAASKITAERSVALHHELELLASDLDTKKLALAEYLDRRWVELGDFGISRQARNEYLLYLRTPEYVLRNGAGEYFLFGSAKIGVSLIIEEEWMSFSLPFVVGAYPHPFIRDPEGSKEMICLGGRMPDQPLTTAEGAVQSLLLGRETLLRGYIPGEGSAMRSGRPWHQLDLAIFHTHLVAGDDPRIREGKLQVTNAP